jgi:hypothetical protein
MVGAARDPALRGAAVAPNAVRRGVAVVGRALLLEPDQADRLASNLDGQSNPLPLLEDLLDDALAAGLVPAHRAASSLAKDGFKPGHRWCGVAGRSLNVVF